ncbi:hypothetical protein STEG23_002565 [Scotinomys teguina]
MARKAGQWEEEEVAQSHEEEERRQPAMKRRCRVTGRLPDKAPTLDKAVPLIKVLIELNGCGNEQMSGIKSKESDRPINKSEHNYNTGYAPQLQYC